MPNLILDYGGDEVSCGLNKVDRSKLYGYVKTEVLDENNEPCHLATLSDDGKTIIGSGGLTYAYIGSNGNWCDKSDLKPVDLDGNELSPVKSTLGVPISLKEKVSVEYYLDHNVRLLYALDPEEGFPSGLLDELSDGAIYSFPFSYRGGLNPDTGFLLEGADGTVWLAVGSATDVQMVGFEQAAPVAEETDDQDGGEDDLMDFGMM